MSELLITRGLPASGKSTWAKAWVNACPEYRARLNRDCMRYSMFDHRKGEGILTYAQEELITLALQSAVRSLLGRGVDVVVDDMNLRPKYVRGWREFAESEGHELVVVPFQPDVELSVERDLERDDRVGASVIRELYHKYTKHGNLLADNKIERPQVVGDKYVPDWRLPKCFIVDIDGTLALNTSGRGWYDLERVSEDSPNEVVADLVGDLANVGGYGTPVYCSGRDERSREVTVQWLIDNDLPDGPLFMRPAHDNRQDAIVKRELFDKHIRNNYNVTLVLDDRDQVVKMWRSLGLTCLQVADGNF